MFGLGGQLEDSVEADLLFGEDAGEGGNDARTVLNLEAQVEGAFLPADGERAILTEAFVGEGETRSGLPARISRATRMRSLTTATPVGLGPAPRP